MKSKFCISSTASFDQINKAPTNHSITKQTFSFARSNRFEPLKPTYIYPYPVVPKIPMVAIYQKKAQEQLSAMAKSQTSPNAWQFRLPPANITSSLSGMKISPKRKGPHSDWAEMYL